MPGEGVRTAATTLRAPFRIECAFAATTQPGGQNLIPLDLILRQSEERIVDGSFRRCEHVGGCALPGRLRGGRCVDLGS